MRVSRHQNVTVNEQPLWWDDECQLHVAKQNKY